jgi:hypothetical protein
MIFKITKKCETKILNLQEYFICLNENLKIKIIIWEPCIEVAKVLQYVFMA